MQTAVKLETTPTARAEAALEAELSTVAAFLAREAGLTQEAISGAFDEIRSDTWSGLLGASTPARPEDAARRAGMRAVARALRTHGARLSETPGATPIPDGLTADAIRGALMEVIPGRRSVAGLYLRGYGREELAVLYELDAADMKARLDGALENFRSSLHRRAERMNVASWSQALEEQPIEAMRGMLWEGSSPSSRLRCTDPQDQAEALNGTHFRGGREGALDHALSCDACAAELRVLFAFRRGHRPADGPELDLQELDRLRRDIRSRPDLRPFLTAAPPARAHRRSWPWVVVALVGALLAWLLL